jgi:hypothetical protein
VRNGRILAYAKIIDPLIVLQILNPGVRGTGSLFRFTWRRGGANFCGRPIAFRKQFGGAKFFSEQKHFWTRLIDYNEVHDREEDSYGPARSEDGQRETELCHGHESGTWAA